MKVMFKKVLPVAIGIVLILLISVAVSGIKSLTNRVPGINEPSKVYATYGANGEYKVTNDRLYSLMKNTYGTAEVLNEIDKIIYAEQLEKADVNSEELFKFVVKEVFGEEEFDELDAEEAQNKWDEVISSLQVSGIITADEATENVYSNTNSKVWAKVKEYYKLSYVRTEWAKAEYLKKHQEARGDGLLFDMTNKENSTNSIEAYFTKNYKGNVKAIAVPFTSKEAAYKTMKQYGINTHANVIVHNGWVSTAYDYTTKEDIEASDELTYEQVFNAFVGMYNEVFKYQNDGKAIISADSYEMTLKPAQTKYLVSEAVTKGLDAHEKNYGTSANVPTEVTVNLNDGTTKKATVKWEVKNEKFASYENGVITPKFSEEEKDSITVSVTYTVDFEGEVYSKTTDLEFKATYGEDGALIENKKDVTVEEVEAFYAYSFKDEFLDQVNDKFMFNWSYNDAKAISDTFASYVSVDSTKLTINDNTSQLYKSYTVTPVEIGNYYYLILKLEDVAQVELFVKDADGNNQKGTDDKYLINSQEIYDEILAKKTEELLGDNAINEMIYENRVKHNVKIFDSYIEAIYEYEYRQFYETTLKLTDYKKYEVSKKNKKDVVFSVQKVAGDKKSVVSYTAQQLFESLEKKYASSCVATLVENYMLISNKDFNDIYNPYTNEVMNKTTYKNLMEAEISTLRKNFESGYFTNSYLSYYGFTPNFPAKYGWKKFIKDYFVATNDQELLTISTYGGSIYSNAIQAYTDTLYGWTEIQAEMNKALDKYFSVSTINLIIYTDYNYNYSESGDNAAQVMMEEKDNWTEEQKALAGELADFLYANCDQTNAATVADQMKAIAKLYNEAGYEYDEVKYAEALADNDSIYDFNYFGKFKAAGLLVKFETAAAYTSASSIMEEYADECRVLWKEAGNLGLYNKVMDVPLLSKNLVKTDYGYHKIAIVSATSAEALPTEEEVFISRAQALVDAAQEKIKTAEENIKTYSERGYNTSSYEAEKAVAAELKAKYEAELKAVLAKYGKAEDYTLDDEAKARITTWYTPAETTIEGGTLVTEDYIANLKGKVTFTNPDNGPRFETFLELLKKECEKQNEE